nr:MAG TPA: hypothetical protein [Caudoviricetes sp.]
MGPFRLVGLCRGAQSSLVSWMAWRVPIRAMVRLLIRCGPLSGRLFFAGILWQS